MDLFDKKLELLKLYFPAVEPKVLSELLESCGESIEKTKELICGEKETSNKRRIGALYQSSLPGVTEPVMRKRIKNNSKKSRVLYLHTPEQVKEHLWPYVSFYRNFLQHELSDVLLKSMMSKTDLITPKEFYLFNNPCKSSHGSRLFVSPEGSEEIERIRGLNYNGEEYNKLVQYDEPLKRTSLYIEKFMNDTEIPSSKRLPYQSREKWNSHMCVVNYYEKNSDHLDYHSDRLSHIGPHNFIASLSIGATREFRLRKNYGDTQIYSIIIPHNSMVVMRAGCQEEYRHSVNAIKNSIESNPISGSRRFNLTFRFFPQEFMKNVPRCKCGLSMVLRRSFKTVETRGKYFWSCENIYQNKDCGEFHWANFDAPDNNFRANDENESSVWIAGNDVGKWEWVSQQMKDS